MGSKPSIITHIITSLAPGGAEIFLLRLTSSLKDFRHHIISLAPIEDAYFANQLRECAESVISLNMNSKNLLAVHKVFYLWRLLKQQSPNLVQTWMYHANVIGGLVAAISKIPVIWSIHNSSLNKETPEILKFNTFTNCLVKAGAWLSNYLPQAIVSCSQTATSLHKKWGYKTDKFVFIPNGVDTELFHPQPELKHTLRKTWGIENVKTVIGFVGRFHPQKDIPNFLKAASLFLIQEPDTCFIFCGNELTKENSILKGWIGNEGISNHCLLLGKIRDINITYNAFDIVCLPSSYGEALPTVIVEAMACGIPCVGTDVGDTKSIIGHLGITVPPKDHQALAKAWKDLSTKQIDPIKIRQRILDNFTLAAGSNAYRNLYLKHMTKT